MARMIPGSLLQIQVRSILHIHSCGMSAVKAAPAPHPWELEKRIFEHNSLRLRSEEKRSSVVPLIKKINMGAVLL